jgi:hypothetical protein
MRWRRWPAAALLMVSGYVYSEPLYVVPQGVETRWASPENPRAERGQAARSNAGRKGAAAFTLKAGESRTLAQVESGRGVVRRMWMTLLDRSPKMLRLAPVAERISNLD